MRLNNGITKLLRFLDYPTIGRRLLKHGFDPRLNKALLEVQLYYFGRLKSKKNVDTETFFLALQKLCSNREFANSIESTTKSIDRFTLRFEKFGKLMEEVFGQTILGPSIVE